MTFTRRTFALLTLLLVVQPALAAEPAPYITAKQLDLTTILPPPPPAESAVEKSELAAVIAEQKSASPERIKLANEDVEETVFAMFTRTLGDKFVTANLPKATVFFTRALGSEGGVVDPAKAFFGRVRPYMADPDIKPLVKPSAGGSWPSGHTTRVTLAAIILSSMVPEHKDAILARAGEYAESRVIGGMHYPSDLEAAHRAGSALAAVMFNDPAFKADYAGVKTEVRAALGLN